MGNAICVTAKGYVFAVLLEERVIHARARVGAWCHAIHAFANTAAEVAAARHVEGSAKNSAVLVLALVMAKRLRQRNVRNAWAKGP